MQICTTGSHRSLFTDSDFTNLAPHVDAFSLMTYDYSRPGRFGLLLLSRYYTVHVGLHYTWLVALILFIFFFAAQVQTPPWSGLRTVLSPWFLSFLLLEQRYSLDSTFTDTTFILLRWTVGVFTCAYILSM